MDNRGALLAQRQHIILFLYKIYFFQEIQLSVVNYFLLNILKVRIFQHGNS